MKDKKSWIPCVGDRVVNKRVVGTTGKVGVYGTIRKVKSCDSFLVEFDKNIGGHSGSGSVQNGHGWWCDQDHVKPVHLVYPIITIQTDGKTTTATLREGHKILNSAKAVCCEEDEFDYLTGAKIALERVMKKEEKKFEIGMRVKDSGYNDCFDWGYVTHIREDNKYVFITPLDCMSDFLKNGAKEHENCFMIDEDYSTILKDKED